MDGSISNRTFKHSGRLGDLIYALPAVKALGGGRLYLDAGILPGFAKEQVAQLIPLLETQSYIASASVRQGQSVDYDLDRFRMIAGTHSNLALAHLAAFELEPRLCEGPWLETERLGAAEAFEVVLARCSRRHEIPGFWKRVYELFGREAVFVGTPEEHREFEKRYGPIPYAPTPNLKDLAALIHGCRLFVGNQSCPYAIAEGLGKPCLLEVDKNTPNCLFTRPEVAHVFEGGDLWKIDLVAEMAQRDCEPLWHFLEPSPLGQERTRLWDELRAMEQLELRLRDRKPFQVQVGGFDLQSGEGGAKEFADPGVLALPSTPRSRIESVLLESLFRITEVPSSPGLLQADPIAPIIDARTAATLGTAESPGCSVVVLTYNSESTIENCLSRAAQSLSERDEIIVVDNASSDGTVSLIERLAEKIPLTLIQNQSNLGFSAGANVGMRASKGRYIALLNPDAYVPIDWIPRLITRLSDPLAGAVGPVSNKVAGKQFIGSHLPYDTPPGLSEAELSQVLEVHAGRSLLTKMLIGFCILFRRSTLDKIGLLDEDLYLGSDDLELSLRIRSHGLRLVVARDVLVWHESGASFASLGAGDKDRLLDQSSKALRDKIVQLFAPGPAPCSESLWDSDIFGHMLAGTGRNKEGTE